MEFAKLLQDIDRCEIRYLLVGGVAVNLHGIIRPTNDIDLVIYLEKDNLTRFLTLLKSLGFRPKIPVDPVDFADPNKRREWIKKKNMIVFSFYHRQDMTKVIDVFVKHPIPFEGAYRRRVLIPLGKATISVMSIPDLIKLKKKANRLQDKSDIVALKKVLKIQKELK